MKEKVKFAHLARSSEKRNNDTSSFKNTFWQGKERENMNMEDLEITEEILFFAKWENYPISLILKYIQCRSIDDRPLQRII